MITFLDTETTDKADFNARARDPKQPHLVSATLIMCDETMLEYACFNAIIKPEGWESSPEALSKHGITTEQATAQGIDEKEAAAFIIARMRESSVVVGHNIQFDKFLMRIAGRRYDLISDEDDAAWKSMPTFCTMRALTKVMNLPGGIKGQAKWPKLEEAYEFCFKQTLENAHNSLADVRACKRIYNWILTHPEIMKGEKASE